MVRLGIAAGLVAFMAGWMPAAAEPDERPFVKLEGGYLFELETQLSGSGPNSEVNADAGWIAGGTIGFYPLPRWRAEFEVHQQKSDIASATNGFTPDGELKAQTAMVSIYRDLPITDRIRPYIGGGVGAVQVNPNFTLNDGTDFRNDKSLQFGWQASAGVAIDLDDHFVFDTRYRYMRSREFDFAGSEGRYENHAIMAGLRVKFGARGRTTPRSAPPRAVAPAPAPQPVAPTPPAPEPETQQPMMQLLFFPFNSAEITEEAGEVIDAVAEEIGERNVVGIEIEGHTDTSGASAYNDRLSRRRAEAVRDALVARGVANSNIRLIAKGEREPRVATGDGVRSPLNRFVRILVIFQ